MVTKTQYMGGGELPKKGGGAWTISRFRGGLGKKDGVVFLRGGVNMITELRLIF